MPAAILRRAWLVLDNELPTIQADWPKLQQADRMCRSHLHDTQNWNLLSRKTEKAAWSRKDCCHNIRERGEVVWYCVSRRPEMLCRIQADCAEQLWGRTITIVANLL